MNQKQAVKPNAVEPGLTQTPNGSGLQEDELPKQDKDSLRRRMSNNTENGGNSASANPGLRADGEPTPQPNVLGDEYWNNAVNGNALMNLLGKKEPKRPREIIQPGSDGAAVEITFPGESPTAAELSSDGELKVKVLGFPVSLGTYRTLDSGSISVTFTEDVSKKMGAFFCGELETAIEAAPHVDSASISTNQAILIVDPANNGYGLQIQLTGKYEIEGSEKVGGTTRELKGEGSITTNIVGSARDSDGIGPQIATIEQPISLEYRFSDIDGISVKILQSESPQFKGLTVKIESRPKETKRSFWKSLADTF